MGVFNIKHYLLNKIYKTFWGLEQIKISKMLLFFYHLKLLEDVRVLFLKAFLLKVWNIKEKVFFKNMNEYLPWNFCVLWSCFLEFTNFCPLFVCKCVWGRAKLLNCLTRGFSIPSRMPSPVTASLWRANNIIEVTGINMV